MHALFMFAISNDDGDNFDFNGKPVIVVIVVPVVVVP